MRDQHKITIDKENCSKCGLCVKDCPMNILEMTNEGANVKQEVCLFCGHCLAICPKNVVSISGFEDEPIELTEPKLVNAEEFLTHMKTRRSIRHFKADKVSKEMLDKIIAAGQYSPTGSNSQNVSYTVLQDDLKTFENIAIDILTVFFKNIGAVNKAYANIVMGENYLFKKAPLVIVIKSTNDVDGTIAAASMEIMANALGLGVFYSGMFARAAQNSPELSKMLEVGENDKVVTALVVGHPDVKYLRTAPKETPTVTYK